MGKVHLYGENRLSRTPALYIPSRMDMDTLLVLVEAMGGTGSVTFLVGHHFLPEVAMVDYMERESSLIRFDFAGKDSRGLRERIRGEFAAGKSVLFVPGTPVRHASCVSDVPEPVMEFFSALHIAPVPVFVGFYRDGFERVMADEPEYDRAVVEVCAKLAPGPMAAEGVLDAWLQASSYYFSHQPQVETSLARMLVESMRKYSHVRLEEGADDTSMEYGKLLGVAMAMARWISKNVKERRVGVLMPPSKGGIIADLACFLAGVVPVNINYTSSESGFESIRRQSGIKRFITTRPFKEKMSLFPWPENTKMIYMEDVFNQIGTARLATWVAFAKFAPMSMVSRVFALDKYHGHDEAVLLFTSGSSGVPKGVSLSHRMLVGQLMQLQCKMFMPVGSAVLACLPIFHSFGLAVCALMPLAYGLTMVTYPSPLDAKRLNELVVKHKCRMIATTPTFARSMMRRANKDTFKSVGHFMVGAEKLQKPVEDEFFEKCGIHLMEGYGLTEASPVVACCMRVIGPKPGMPYFMPEYKFGSVGQLLPGHAVRITDPDDDNVRLPITKPGMLWIKGVNIFQGYIGREDLNKEILKDGWLKTGDLASVDLNGILSIGGRRSRFSKIGGEMVPHEVVEQAIESCITKPEGFSGRPVIIMGVVDAKKGEALVLLSAVHHSKLTDALAKIKEDLVAQGLPRLWCPREIVPVERIPMLPTGKTDLKSCQMLANEALGLPV